MADLPLINIKALLVEREDMDAGVVQQLRTGLAESSKQYNNLKEAVDVLQDRLQQSKGDPAKLSLKIGIASFLMGFMERANSMLSTIKVPLAFFYRGQALNELGKYEEAMASLDAAGKAGYANSEVQLHRAASLRGLQKYDESLKTLQGLDKYVQQTAEYCYQYGQLLASKGEDRNAIPYFEKALEADPRHSGALFHLAYANDMAGNDDEAINLYERCLQTPPARAGTLINLGILYEDHCRFDKAAYCFEQVLKQYPDHARAKMFYRDAQASYSQFYDEDAESRSTRFSAMLDIPVTDFELSVRSRNCLRKMDINTLGDLVRCTEPQLLASKNFGETSLHEIKQMLTMKGLRLGMGAESKRPVARVNMEEYSAQEQAMLGKPIAELNFSVRARKCMARLGIATVGELLAHSTDELLECKNFGVTSLVEVKNKISTLGLKLRGD